MSNKEQETQSIGRPADSAPSGTVSMPAPVVLVSVSDETIYAVEHGGRVWVPLRRVCEALGITADAQRVKLQASAWATTAMIAVVDPAGRARDAFCLRLDSLPMWLATIDAARVEPTVAPRLVAFQREAHDALARHFGLMPRSTAVTRGSGGSTMSGARELLAMVDHLSGALKSTLDEVGVVRAEAARAAVAADDAARLAQLALEEVRAGAGGRLRRARLDAAVQHITSAIRRHCAREGRPYQAIYSEVRRELGLRRTQDGGPALGRAKLDARQILTLARVASQLGVPGVGARVVERIMTGEDDLRAQGPGGRDVVDAITPEPKRPAQPLLLEAFGLGCAS